jgi:hypothetical protein
MVTLQKQQAQDAEEKRQKDARLLFFKQNQDAVRAQMAKNQEVKAAQKLVVIEEGAATRAKLEDRKYKMERIKENKIDELKQSNIPDFLMNDLVKQQIKL